MQGQSPARIQGQRPGKFRPPRSGTDAAPAVSSAPDDGEPTVLCAPVGHQNGKLALPPGNHLGLRRWLPGGKWFCDSGALPESPEPKRTSSRRLRFRQAALRPPLHYLNHTGLSIRHKPPHGSTQQNCLTR